MYDRPRGYEVFTHDESKDIIRALNRMPGYANGASSPGEADRVVGRLNSEGENRHPQQLPPQELTVNVMLPDGRVLASVVVDDVTRLQQRKQNRGRKVPRVN